MSDANKGYNGWTNYETWNVALWIGNEQGSHEYWEKEQAEECYAETLEEPRLKGRNTTRDEWTDRAAEKLAERMKDEFEENMPKLEGCYGDLLSAALSEVNWYEIAKNYIEDLDRDEIEKELTTADADADADE